MSKKSSEIAKEIADILLDINAVAINVNQPFRYTSGLLSPVYSDMRLLISHVDERRKVIGLWAEALKEEAGDFDIIAGTATGAIPHAAWLADALDKPMVYIRGSAKGHGKQNQVEGVVDEGQTAIIIEDLISTGKSSIESVEAMRALGATVKHISSIFSYTLPQSTENAKQAQVTLNSLTTFPEVVAQAVGRNVLTSDQEKIVLDWLNDAAGWAGRHNLEATE